MAARGAASRSVPLRSSRSGTWLDDLVKLMQDGLRKMPTHAQMRANYPA